MPASTLAIVRARPDSPDALMLIGALDDDLKVRYRIDATFGLHPQDVRDPGLIFLIASLDGRPVGCGAVRGLEPGVGEVKRMFVRPECRGRGIARALLSALEAGARSAGYTLLRLETGTEQPEAVGLYQSAGYRPAAPYGEYVGAPHSLYFEKSLAADP